MKARLLTAILLSVLLAIEAFAIDCNLPYGDPPCECCSENWDGNEPPKIAYVVFQGIERTDCNPGWVMLPPPNNRLFLLRRTEEYVGNTCAWSYNLDAVGGEGGPESDIWVIHFDLTAYYSDNVYLANKVDDPGSDMIYFFRRGLTDCRTVYTHEHQVPSCEPFVRFWAGGTARIFWSLDFNSDGIVDFKDLSIITSTPVTSPAMQRFAENWLKEY